MNVQESQKPYILSESLHKRIYSDIRDQFFSQLAPPSEPKRAFYLGAQPGSGKTALRNYLLDAEDIRKNTVVLNTDELRDYHPLYHSLQNDKQLYSKAPYLVNPDASMWYVALQKEAAEKGFHIIYDMTFGGNVQTYLPSMRERLVEGYQPSLHIMAIKDDLSKLGIYLRYETQMENKGSGRFVSMAAHDINYKNLVPNVEIVCNEIPWAKTEVFNRHIDVLNGVISNNAVRPIYSSQEVDKERLVGIINQERSRPWSAIEKEYLQFRINQVEDLITKRGGDLTPFRQDMQNLLESIKGKSKEQGLSI